MSTPRVIPSEVEGSPSVLLAALANMPYNRAHALSIESIARDRTIDWPLRRLAALMLEGALLRIKDKAERRFWTERFGMTDPAELRREGYAERPAIEIQLWRRMERLTHVHRLPMPDYLRSSERECRLTLSRYLFGVDEVIARIEGELRRSEGIEDTNQYGEFRVETAHAIETLPAMERAIVEHLSRDAVMRWAAVSTPKTLDALVAQPIGTVVAVIRPPGSTHEIEIKRAGRPRALPLDAVYQRDGKVVCYAHHLDGGSELNSIAYEAEHGAFFSHVFREVHGFDASMSRSLTVARADTLPTGGGEADLQHYFNTPALHGARFYEMRWHLYHAVRVLAQHAHVVFRGGDDEELTRAFIRYTKPAQAIQIGTTALRLDRISRYLGSEGAKLYFEDGLNAAHDADDDRRFADHLLDEVLGVYEPPRGSWRSYRHYVESAFRENRERADRVYLSLFEQIGRFWGTLLAVRGHSRGESFVERNAGLRSVWSDGAWQVRIVFMDHDSLVFGLLDTRVYRPRAPLLNAMIDADHILGGIYTKVQHERGEVGCLREIYRAGAGLHRRGIDALRASMRNAYDKTHAAMRSNAELAALFPQAVLPRVRDFDDAVRCFLRSKGERWIGDVRAMLASRGYDADVIDEYVTLLREEGWFLRRIAWLFDQSAGNAATTSSITRAPAGRSRPPMAVRAGHGVWPSPGSQSA